MPSTMIHLYTAVQLIKTCSLVQSKPQFFLGCISPDAVNLNDFAPKDIRWSAHIRHNSTDEWIQRAIDFYTDNLVRAERGELDKDLLLGYTLHIFSDIAWDKKFDSDMREAIAASDMTQEQKLKARWDEFYYYDKTQFASSWWLDEVKPALAQSEAMEINKIPANLINKYKDFCLNEYESSIDNVTPTIITQEIVEKFSLYATAMMKNEL